jgi:hypothetical protein
MLQLTMPKFLSKPLLPNPLIIISNTASSTRGRGERNFPLASVSRTALGPTQPPVQQVPGGPFPRAKALPRRDANHSPQLITRSRMSRSYTSSSPKDSMACNGIAITSVENRKIRHMEKYTFQVGVE